MSRDIDWGYVGGWAAGALIMALLLGSIAIFIAEVDDPTPADHVRACLETGGDPIYTADWSGTITEYLGCTHKEAP